METVIGQFVKALSDCLRNGIHLENLERVNCVPAVMAVGHASMIFARN